MNFLGSFISAIKPRNDDDGIDRLNYYYTVMIICIFSLTISAKQYVGAPIQCWVPAQFTGAWEQYAENYCFVQNTYWLPLHDPIPRIHGVRDAKQIGYYQWVPFILAIEAIFFYIPAVLWRQLNWQSGINVLRIIDMAADTKNIEIEAREKAVKVCCRHIEDAIELQREFKSKGAKNLLSVLLQCGKTKGTYVSMVYILTKLLYVTNVIGQFFLLDAFLGPKDVLWGLELLSQLVRGQEWEESGHFPRVTLCDFEVRVLGNLHRYTIQCVLMINMFNEKIFLFLWWWFVFVACATIGNTIFFILNTTSHSRRFAFIVRYLRVANAISPEDRYSVHKFVSHNLRPDGVFMIRMIASHAGDLVATDIVNTLWENFRSKQPKQPLLYVDSAGGLKTVENPNDGFLEKLYREPGGKKEKETIRTNV